MSAGEKNEPRLAPLSPAAIDADAANAASGFAVRPVTEPDAEAVGAVLTAAFARPDEATILGALATEGAIIAAPVAVTPDRRLVGACGFFQITAQRRSGGVPTIAGLGPLGVHPSWQNRGVGKALVRYGLIACRAAGVDVVLVLGEPDYYRRFGFSVKAASGVRCVYAGPNLLAAVLTDRAGHEPQITVRYPKAFG